VITTANLLVKRNTPPKVKTKDKNLKIIEDKKEQEEILEKNKRIKQLVEAKEKEYGRKLTAVEMNKLLGRK
jgi:hypothetical protein